MDSRLVLREPGFDQVAGFTFDTVSFPAHYIHKSSVTNELAHYRLAGITDRFLLVGYPEGPGDRIRDPVLDRPVHLDHVEIPRNHRVTARRLGALIAVERLPSYHCPEVLREYPLHGNSQALLNAQRYLGVQAWAGLSDVFAEAQD